MISTTKQTKTNTFKKILKAILIATFWILIWEAASRLVSRNNELLLLILPSPFTVLKKWTEIAFTAPFIKAELLTLARVFLGFIAGSVIGFVLGIVTHISKLIYSLLSPVLKIIRAVPVVAIIILMYLFFESSTLPILIVCLMVLPIIWQTVHDGCENTDKQLLEMAQVYNVSAAKAIFSIKLPYIIPSLITACVNALGLAWKSGVAAEVICLPTTSLGTLLWQGKGSVNFDEVYAVTFTVVILSIIIEFVLKFLCRKYLARKGGAIND
ncbi:MAG: ABC transporter permease subunit [Clostridia bacterium]|nr:ABC transporter permease subunit [Clostridia bacterium]